MMSTRRVFATALLVAVTAAAAATAVAAETEWKVGPVPQSLREELKLSPFYQQHVDVGGFPVLASDKPSPYALLEAAYLIDRMIGHRDDIRAALARSKVRFTVMAAGEQTTDVPEHSDLKPKEFWDRRARGLGPTPVRPCVSCGEENLLCLRGDPYAAENILIHEFAHAIHDMGLRDADPTFDGRLRKAYHEAMAKGLWKGKYAAGNRSEYWAEGVQSWFDTNRPPDHDHNHVRTREALRAYDPGLAKLVEEIFGDGEWRYVRSDERKELGHLAGLRRDEAPAFEWPEHLKGRQPKREPDQPTTR